LFRVFVEVLELNIESTSIVALLVIPIVLSVITTLGTFYVQERKLRADLRTEFMAEATVRRLLQSPKWEMRSFDIIKKSVGDFTDEELRRFLVRAGAVRFWNLETERELWGLIERNLHVIEGTDDDDASAGDTSEDRPNEA
jgi:hypothetical protein